MFKLNNKKRKKPMENKSYAGKVGKIWEWERTFPWQTNLEVRNKKALLLYLLLRFIYFLSVLCLCVGNFNAK